MTMLRRILSGILLLNTAGARVTYGYLPGLKSGEVHVLATFRPTTLETEEGIPNLSIQTKLITTDEHLDIVALNGKKILQQHELLRDCDCSCVRSGDFVLARADVEPKEGLWQWSRDISENEADSVSLVAIVLTTCEAPAGLFSDDDIVEYDVTFTNGDGSHTAREESGMRDYYTLLMFMWEIAAVAFFIKWIVYYKRHGSVKEGPRRLLRIFGVASTCYSGHLGCEVMHLSAYEKDGVGQPLVQVISVMALVAGHAVFAALLLLLPSAYISDSSGPSSKLPQRKLANALTQPRRLALLLCTFTGLSFWAEWASTSSRFAQAAATPGPSHEVAAVAAAGIEVLVLAVFSSRCIAVASHPSHERGLRLFFTRVLYYFIPFFGISILSLLLHVVCRPWSRLLAMTGVVSIAVVMGAFTGMAWILWPSTDNWVLLDGKAATDRDIVQFPKILSIISRPVQLKSEHLAFDEEAGGDFLGVSRRAYDEIPSSSLWPIGRSAQESGERNIQMEAF